MKPLIAFLTLLLVISCVQPENATLTPSSAFGGNSTPTLSADYAPFDGQFWGNGVGCTVGAKFDKNTVFVTCITANAIVYFDYTFVLDNGTITTYDGEYPIIWWFQCKQYPYEWVRDGLIITDPVNNRVLILEKED